MNKSTGMILAAFVITVLGRWSTPGKKLDWSILPYIILLVIMISFLSMMSEKLAEGFAALALFASLIAYGPTILGNRNLNGNTYQGVTPPNFHKGL